MEKKEFKEPELIEAQAKLKLGDTIKCSNADEMIYLQTELAKEDIQVDFVYERNGEKGLWPLICKARRQQA